MSFNNLSCLCKTRKNQFNCDKCCYLDDDEFDELDELERSKAFLEKMKNEFPNTPLNGVYQSTTSRNDIFRIMIEPYNIQDERNRIKAFLERMKKEFPNTRINT